MVTNEFDKEIDKAVDKLEEARQQKDAKKIKALLKGICWKTKEINLEEIPQATRVKLFKVLNSYGGESKYFKEVMRKVWPEGKPEPEKAPIVEKMRTESLVMRGDGKLGILRSPLRIFRADLTIEEKRLEWEGVEESNKPKAEPKEVLVCHPNATVTIQEDEGNKKGSDEGKK
jgi:hypothetical protein